MTRFSVFENPDGWVERIVEKWGGSKDICLEGTAVVQKRGGHSPDEHGVSGGGRGA